jgi:protease-4
MSFEDARVAEPSGWPREIVVRHKRSRWLTWLLGLMLIGSVFFNLALLGALSQFATDPDAPTEAYVSGKVDSEEKIALLEISGTIMPPYTERWLKAVETIEKDDAVKGVVVRVDSPGGLVADSHQLYHALQRLREETGKPVYVSMARIAASGGYYLAMGAGPEGKIYAEPTTWTGSIGVIIPRYDVSSLAQEMGVESEPLTTGPFKDSLSPFRELSAEERAVWEAIMEDAFQQFKQVVVSGRAQLDEAAVAKLATGQVFTATQAQENGLIDEIGFRDDVIDALAETLGLDDPRVVRYEHPVSLVEMLLGAASARSQTPWEAVLETSVPRAMYFCGWGAGLEFPSR